ncbi:MAG: DUF3565 domain-containing protein [Gammaproteobacteria bacterium]|nr:MAG: DUF3565 domain-containing protein [Gammaproteobacteria bacterium]
MLTLPSCRHKPPWINNAWILKKPSRQAMIGKELDFKLCDIIRSTD